MDLENLLLYQYTRFKIVPINPPKYMYIVVATNVPAEPLIDENVLMLRQQTAAE